MADTLIIPAPEVVRALFETLPLKFQRKVRIEFNGCWTWLGGKGPTGYALYNVHGAGTSRPAHLWAYEQLIGPVAIGLELDHYLTTNGCEKCANPWHCEPVTHLENMQRFNATRVPLSVCKRGHDKQGRRQCASCIKITKAAYSAGMGVKEYERLFGDV